MMVGCCIMPLRFVDTYGFFPSYAIEDLIRAYAILGGVPAYLEQFDSEISIADNVREHIVSKGTSSTKSRSFSCDKNLGNLRPTWRFSKRWRLGIRR